MEQLDTLTLDQIRLFLCVADEGSFSAAARHLHRAQSAVSYGVANLEKVLGVQLFDRSTHRPTLTPAGQSLLSDARQVFDSVRKLRTQAASVADGLELEVSIAVDAICPADLLVQLGHTFLKRYPKVSLRIQTEVLEAVSALVLDGSCQIGLSGPVGVQSRGLERRFLAYIPMVPVASSSHGLADIPCPIARQQVLGQVQIVISQRGSSASSGDHGVISEKIWRVADAATKLTLIRAGLGWGNLPLGLVSDDLEKGTLVKLVLEEQGPEPLLVPLSLITRSDAPPGPAGQWLLKELAAISKLCPHVAGEAS
ncbi:MAG TPA: LysR family transcriptional regulator [Planctomycetes bacterium]|nr:LysR family transcriptional regulator [Planctomycetota bacterium]